MNEKKLNQNKKQTNFPDFEKFMEIVKSSRAAFDQHPQKIEPGQVWGVAEKDYRFIVISNPEKSLTGNDVRVVPVVREIGLASEEDVIIPGGAVYRASSVVMPFQVTNIMINSLDLYFGNVDNELVGFLQATVLSGKLADLPAGSYLGEADVLAPEILQYNTALKKEFSLFAEEVFQKIDELAAEPGYQPVKRIISGIWDDISDFLKAMVSEPQLQYNLMAAPGDFNFRGLGKSHKKVIADESDLVIFFVVKSGRVSIEFQSKKFEDPRSIGNIKLESTRAEETLKFQSEKIIRFTNRKITVDIPAGIIEAILKMREMILTFECDDQKYEYLIKD